VSDKKITRGEVQAAEAKLAQAKDGKDPKKKAASMQEVADLRMAYRQQEEAAGNRSGLIAVEED